MARITGLEEILDNIAKETRAIVGASAKGVLKGGLLVMRESQKLAPINLGNLRNSRFLVSNIPGLAPSIGGAFKGKQAGNMASDHKQLKAEVTAEAMAMSQSSKGPTVAVGYSALYALAVHENPEAGNTGKKGAARRGAWKFLEGPLNENASKILDIIRREAKID